MRGYLKTKEGTQLAYLLPPDDVLAMLTFDEEILEAAVIERRASGRSHYLDPDTLASLNLDWQMQCRIWEHVVDFGLDFSKVPKEFKG